MALTFRVPWKSLMVYIHSKWKLMMLTFRALVDCLLQNKKPSWRQWPIEQRKDPTAPVKSHNRHKQTAQGVGERRSSSCDWFEACQFSWPITEQSKARPMQSRITKNIRKSKAAWKLNYYCNREVKWKRRGPKNPLHKEDWKTESNYYITPNVIWVTQFS